MMQKLFEEIDCQATSIGEISLRKRVIPGFSKEAFFEIKLGEEFLMSSIFVEAEEALARLGLQATEGQKLDVIVGGLGLGYTAVQALKDSRVANLFIVEIIDTVIQWHREEKIPLGKNLNDDSRSRYVHGSFFDMALTGFDVNNENATFDAILLDIDHSPHEFLNQENSKFYNAPCLTRMAEQLNPNGVFSMWSQNPPDKQFEMLLQSVFGHVESTLVSFYNSFRNCESTNTVYVCKKIT